MRYPDMYFFRIFLDFLFQISQSWEIMGTNKKDGPIRATVFPPDVIKKNKFFCILWKVFYNMYKIQNYLIKSTVEKKTNEKVIICGLTP